MQLLSEIRFASFLAYSPRGKSENDRKSREIRDGIKQDQRRLIELAAQRIEQRWDQLGFEAFLGPDVLLVPVPRSAPLSTPETLWPGRRICEELVARKLGKDILACLERHTPVPKAAFALPGERTKAQRHSETMRVLPPLILPEHRVLLAVDDFVTSGSMLLASASLLGAAFPGSTVLAFGLVRTSETVAELIDPCVGRITYDQDSGLTRRRP